MARIPKPWFWKARKAWYVTIDGTRHPLGDDKEQAYARFHQMMANPTRRKVRGDSVVSLCDLFLSWTKQNRSEKTYHWYRQFLQAFVNSIPANLTVDALKPYHVQRWLDATPGQTDNTKRGKLGAVKRAVTWARKQGYTDHDPLAGLERPAAGRRETVITPAEFERMLEHCPDEAFRMLLTVAWETGARPQELTAVEARHVDLNNSRWVFPRDEAKGKKRPRIVYLSEAAEAITRTLIERHPEGPLFRNTNGQPWSKDAINCRFVRLKPKLKRKHCLYHFRHSFATRMLQSGMDPLTVAELLGHSDPSMLARVYQHLSHDPQHMLQQLRRSTG